MEMLRGFFRYGTSGVRPFMFTIGLSTAMHTWVVLQGYRNFHGDMAVPGLMAQHVLRGEFALYEWGHLYFGALHPILIAPFLWLFGEGSIVAMRMVNIPLFALSNILFSTWVYRFFGRREAILTSALLALPAFRQMEFVYFHQFLLWAPVAGLLLLLACSAPPAQLRQRLTRAAWMGFLGGLGLWLKSSFLEYILVLSVLLLFASPEWKRVYGWCMRFFSRIPWLFDLLRTVLLAACAVAVLTVSVANILRPYKEQALLFLIVVAVIGLLASIIASKRRGEYLSLLLCALGGFFVGNAPQWIGSVFFGIHPDSQFHFSFQGWQPLYDVVYQIIPRLWATIPIDSWGTYPIASGVWAWIFVVAFCGTLLFLWRVHGTIFALLRIRPLSMEEMRTSVVVVLFVLPLIALSFRGGVNSGSVRHVQEAWPMAALMVAIGLAGVLRKHVVLGVAISASLILCIAWGNGRMAYFIGKNPEFSPQNVQELKSYFSAHNVEGGYGDYWTVYALNFLTKEHPLLAPLHGFNRYPAYGAAVEDLSVYGLVLKSELHKVDENTNDPTDIIAAFTATNLREKKFEHLYLQILNSSFVDRTTIGKWDVWILEKNI